MRETRKSNHRSQPSQVLDDVRENFVFELSYFFFKNKIDPLQEVVEDEYTKLYRQTHKAAVKTAR